MAPAGTFRLNPYPPSPSPLCPFKSKKRHISTQLSTYRLLVHPLLSLTLQSYTYSRASPKHLSCQNHKTRSIWPYISPFSQRPTDVGPTKSRNMQCTKGRRTPTPQADHVGKDGGDEREACHSTNTHTAQPRDVRLAENSDDNSPGGDSTEVQDRRQVAGLTLPPASKPLGPSPRCAAGPAGCLPPRSHAPSCCNDHRIHYTRICRSSR